MSAIVKHLPHTVDLNEPIKKTYIDTLLATEDNLAHCFDITMKQGVPSGAAVNAYFIRYSDNATIILTGTVSGNMASVTLNKSCYNKAGQYAVIIKVVADSVTNTVFYGEGTIFTSITDTILDPENVVPSLSDLLAQIEAMEAGTAAANTATNRANAAAERCEQMQIDASGMAGDSNKLNGKDAKYYLGTRNLLDNSYWEISKEIVNQRGQTSYTGSGYTIDRWENWGTDVVTTIEDRCLSITSPQAHGIKQAVNGDYTGKVLTLAVCDSDGNVKCSYATVPAKTTSTQYMFAVNFGSCAIYLYVTSQGLLTVQFNVSSNSTFRAKWAALYEGEYTAETLPPYVPKGYAAELAECMRYYYKGPNILEIAANSSNNGASWWFSLPVPTRMRGTPTVIIEKISWVGGCGSEVANANLPEYTYSNYSVNENTAFMALAFTTPPIQITGSQSMYIALRYYLSADL